MILITGASGQLGKDLKLLLRKKNINIISKSRKHLDISKKENFYNLKKFKKIKIIINLAAYTKVDLAEINKKICKNTNVLGVSNLVSLSRKIDACLIHISSDYVFNGKSNKMYKEKDMRYPINYYGLTKKLSEDIIKNSCKKYFIIRTSWIFSKHSNNFISFINKNLKNKIIGLIDNQFGNPTSTNSLSQVLLKLIRLINSNRNLIYGVYNFCNYPKTNWYNFGSFYINNILKRKYININKINGNSLKLKALRPINTSLNSSKITNYLKLKKYYWYDELRKLNKN